jgi:hypothetical protein
VPGRNVRIFNGGERGARTSVPYPFFPLSRLGLGRGSLADELLERMAIGWNQAPFDPKSMGDLTNIEVAVGVHAERVGSNEIPRRTPIGADPAKQYVAVRVEDANVSREIVPNGAVDEGMLSHAPPQAGDVYQPLAVYYDIRRPLDVRPLIEVLAIRTKELYTVVLTVGHQHPLIGGHADAVGEVELTGTGAGLPPRLDQLGIDGESVHPRITVPVTDVKFSV